MTTLRLRADRRLIRARGASVRYLLASITAPRAPSREHRMPVNIALVLDRSGSMAGESKFPLAVEATRKALQLLAPEDRFTLVVFDSRVDVLMPSSLATVAAKKRALRLLESIEPRSSTDLCGGWMSACEELSDFIADGTISRALLLTDGQANHGETNRDVLAHHAAELNRRGITTSCFGVGADFDERLLRDIASEGGGNSYFIQHAAQIADFITSELGEALEVVVPRATLALTIPRGAEITVLNRFRARRAQGRTTTLVELGDLVSGQELEIVLRVKFSSGEIDDVVEIRAEVEKQVPPFGRDDTIDCRPERSEGPAFVQFAYASHAANDDQPRDVIVDREVARIYAGLARAEATEANRHGDFDRARRALVGTARHISEYAGDDPELLALAGALRGEVTTYAEEVMDPMALKASFYIAESSVRGRSVDGKARRG